MAPQALLPTGHCCHWHHQDRAYSASASLLCQLPNWNFTQVYLIQSQSHIPVRKAGKVSFWLHPGEKWPHNVGKSSNIKRHLRKLTRMPYNPCTVLLEMGEKKRNKIMYTLKKVTDDKFQGPVGEDLSCGRHSTNAQSVNLYIELHTASTKQSTLCFGFLVFSFYMPDWWPWVQRRAIPMGYWSKSAALELELPTRWLLQDQNISLSKKKKISITLMIRKKSGRKEGRKRGRQVLGIVIF